MNGIPVFQRFTVTHLPPQNDSTNPKSSFVEGVPAGTFERFLSLKYKCQFSYKYRNTNICFLTWHHSCGVKLSQYGKLILSVNNWPTFTSPSEPLISQREFHLMEEELSEVTFAERQEDFNHTKVGHFRESVSVRASCLLNARFSTVLFLFLAG